MEKSSPPPDPNWRKPTPEFTWEDLATALLPVLACFLGGATEKWAEGIVVTFLGLLLLLNPPRFSHGPVFHGILLALIGCALIAFCPASWFSQPAWRQALVQDFGIVLPTTVSPQPWMTTGCLLSFLAGICWLYYVAGGDVEIRAARRQLRIFAIGVIILAAFSIVLYRAHGMLPFWHYQRGFGPFPHRHQTAILLGITAVLIVACTHDEIRHGKKRWVFWLAGLVVVIAAIILNSSRTGIVLFLIGSFVWLVVLILRSGSITRIAIGLSILLVVAATLFFFGGGILERLHPQEAAGTTTFSQDFRWPVFPDRHELVHASPWYGIGLGNFSPVFGIIRQASLGQTPRLYPQSDWLWLRAELGWPGVILVLAAIAFILWKTFPFVDGTNQWFRLAALIGALLFALHGLVGGSGHRVGTSFAGIFLLAMALRRPFRTRASVALTRSFRVVGLLLVLPGLTWVVTAYRQSSLPGSVGVGVEKRLAASANVGRNFKETIERTTRALAWAPLDGQLYLLRALAEIGAQSSPGATRDDFRRARFLESSSPAQRDVLKTTWRVAAKFHAEQKDFRRAFELAREFGEPPKLPKASSAALVEELEKNSMSNPTNYEAAVTLYQKQAQEKKVDNALVTAQRFTAQSDTPAYFHFLEAESWATKGDWERAWVAWQAFDAAKRK